LHGFCRREKKKDLYARERFLGDCSRGFDRGGEERRRDLNSEGGKGKKKKKKRPDLSRPGGGNT